MKVEDVDYCINMICEGLSYEVCRKYLDPLFNGIRNDEEISKRFATITNSHQKFIESLKNNEDLWQLFDEGCMNWQSSLVVMAHSQYEEVRQRAARSNKLIALALMHDPEPSVRAACVSASSKIADILMHDKHHFVRAVCAVKSESYGLKLMNDPSDFVREWCANWEACARQYVDDKSENVRWRSLYQNKNLAELYIKDPSSEIRLLCFSIDKSYASILKDDNDWKVRKTILIELPEMAKYFLNDENENIRDLAISRLKADNF